MNQTSRRAFIKNTSLFAGFIPFMGFSLNDWSMANGNDELSVHIFSKHLQFLDYKAAGQVAAELGFSGLDLTVRPKGHVLPERVKEDLPKAIKEIQLGGSTCNVMTTAIESVSNPLDVEVLQIASDVGIKYYRTNWFKYKEELTLAESLDFYKEEVKKIGELNKKLGLVGCYQNHAGTKVGASYWEIYKLLESVNPNYFGAQYDIRHALIEGGLSWENGVKLLQSSIKTIVLKDFKWVNINGKWKVQNVPIGKGMVDFDSYFKLLKKYNLNPPVTLHLEYDLGGAEKGKSTINVDKKVVFEAMKQDLTNVQKIWKNA
ncbi:MAG: endonuclease [Bacteroidetes bacterium MedPE-SWsnd-G1]|nr:MAG: endonuclease [Bacteroidetes bacterium MedPE-SWsnd-G1]